MMTERQIKERIEKLKQEIEILGGVLKSPINSKMGRPKGTLKYTQEQINFLKENKDTPMKELIIKFNEKFKTNYTLNTRTIYNFMIREGYKN